MTDKKKILCVDDESSILKSLERLLFVANYEVFKANSGSDGLKVLEMHNGQIDLILIDQRMPQMTGDQFLGFVRERYGKVPSIMLSGYADFESLNRIINNGEIYKFVSKPWDNDELLTLIKAAIASR